MLVDGADPVDGLQSAYRWARLRRGYLRSGQQLRTWHRPRFARSLRSRRVCRALVRSGRHRVGEGLRQAVVYAATLRHLLSQKTSRDDCARILGFGKPPTRIDAVALVDESGAAPPPSS